MNKIYIDELEEKGNELVNYSSVDIADKINDLKDAISNLKWKGPGYQSFISQYNTKMNKLERINNNLSKIASYLITAKYEYDDTNHQINNMYEELLNEYEELKDELQ